MKKYFYKKTLIGIKITDFPEGSIPRTDVKESLGVLTIKLPQKAHISAHIHKPIKRVTHRLQECIVVKKGKIKIKLYGHDKKFFKFLYLKEGQLFLIVNGGHEITVMETCEMYVIKSGPFKEDKVLI